MDTTDILAAFREAVTRRGGGPGDIIADGNIRRLPRRDGKPGNRDFAYLFHMDGIPAGGFENHQDGQGWENYCSRDPGTLSPSEHSEYVAQVAAATAKRKAAEAERHAEAAQEAKQIYDDGKPCESHPYLTPHGVQTHGLRVDADGDLVIPLRDVAGKIHTIQIINAKGDKRFLTGGKVSGHFATFGALAGAPTICVCEGWRTGAIVYQAMNIPVVVAFNCGNLRSVATTIREQYPTARIVLCADDDWKTVGNPGATKANEAARAVGGIAILPSFGTDRTEKQTDWHDLATSKGIGEVTKQIGGFITPKIVVMSDAVESVWATDPPRPIGTPFTPLDYLLGGGFRGVNVLVAPTGVGKTGLALQCGRFAARTGAVLYSSTELHDRQVYSRIAAPILRRSWRDLNDGPPSTARAIAESVRGLQLYVARFRDLTATFATADYISDATGSPCTLILDYLQGAARDASVDRRLAVGAVIQAITDWSESRGGASLVVSSTARVSYMADDRRGRDLVSTAKEAGEIEYAADSVLYLKADQCPMGGEAEAQIAVAKARWGALGEVGLTFSGALGTYRLAAAQGLSDIERKVVSAVRAGCKSRNAVQGQCGGRRDTILNVIEGLTQRGVITTNDGHLSVIDASLAGTTLGTSSQPSSQPGTAKKGKTDNHRESLEFPAVQGGSQSGSHPGTSIPKRGGGSAPLGAGTAPVPEPDDGCFDNDGGKDFDL